MQKSEIYLIFEIEKQKIEIDIEDPAGGDKKAIANNFMMFKNAETLKVTIEERVYKLERDEAAFLQSIR